MENIHYFHRPTISESLGNAWYTMKKYFLWLFLAVIISGIFQGPPNYSFEFDKGIVAVPLVVFLVILGIVVFLFIKPVFSFGSSMMFVEAVRDQKPNLRWLVSGFQKNYLNIVLAHLLQVAIIGIGFVALIIPGIVLACRLSFVPYLVMDKELDPIQAVEESWRMTRGFGWTIFGLAILSFFIAIVGLLCLFVGIFPAIIVIRASFASLYQAILTEKNMGATESVVEEVVTQ
ncbi:MAG: hypothetical protein JW798_17685 [Prolixibacteraceae bacterium]|nr:hypothetical protein [Prolixibacteraceae bacterium]